MLPSFIVTRHSIEIATTYISHLLSPYWLLFIYFLVILKWMHAVLNSFQSSTTQQCVFRRDIQTSLDIHSISLMYINSDALTKYTLPKHLELLADTSLCFACRLYRQTELYLLRWMNFCVFNDDDADDICHSVTMWQLSLHFINKCEWTFNFYTPIIRFSDNYEEKYADKKRYFLDNNLGNIQMNLERKY